MNPELADFLDLCSEDIPLSKKTEIWFYMKGQMEAANEQEELIKTSCKNYYSALYRFENKKIKRTFRFAIIFLFVALLLLAMYILLDPERAQDVVSKVFLESLLIGKWVFAWEAVNTIFF